MAVPENLADWFGSPTNVSIQPESLRRLGYTLVDRLFDFDALPPADRSRAMALFSRMELDPKPSIVGEWKALVRQYPDVPGLKQQLALAYVRTDREELADATIEELVKQHPTYVPGVIRQALHLICEDLIDEAEALLGGPPTNLQKLAPERTSFALYEVGDFAQMAFLYEITKNNADAAEDHLRVMRDLDLYPVSTLRRLKDTLDTTRTMANLARYSDDAGELISISGTFRAVDQQTREAPVFIHPETQWLYEHDLSLPADKRDALLSLPRPSLTADLSTVLLDLVYRFDYFAELPWDAPTQSFGYHALLLATELQAAECLDVVLETLRHGDEVTNFWFNDWREDLYIPYFRRVLPNCADALLAFMQEPSTNTYSKSVVSTAYALEAFLHPDRRPETIQWYETVLNFMIDHADDPAQLDMPLNSLIISDLTTLNAVEVLPQVRELYDRELVEEGINGTLADVEKGILTGTVPEWQLEIKPLADQYAYLHDPDTYLTEHPRSNQAETDEIFARLDAETAAKASARHKEWAFLDEDETDENEDDIDNYQPPQPRHVAPEPGRNDKVSVRYRDGKLVSDVKYKKVEPDVKAGKCTLL